MAKKNYGSFTSTARKVVKQSERLYCQVTEDGKIYVANGYWLFNVTEEEYAQIIRPVSDCAPGNWLIDYDGIRRDHKSDFVRIFKDAAKAALDCVPLESSHMTFNTSGGRGVVGMYDPYAEFAAFYNSDYVAAVSDVAVLRTPSPLSPAVAFVGPDPVALVMPIKPQPETSRSVLAYFGKAAGEKLSDELPPLYRDMFSMQNRLEEAHENISNLKEQLNDTSSRLADAVNLSESLAARVQELEAENAARDSVIALPAPTPATMAESIAAQWSQFDGITATVKGAKTAAPIVWLSGNVKAHAEAIKASGGRWSCKKSAYYFNVA